MRLNAPKKIVWYISFILAVLGIVATFITLPFVSTYAIWFVAAGWLLLFLGAKLKGF